MILGVLLVVSLPPAVLFWLLIHPFARFWRGIGPRRTYMTSGALFVLLGTALFRLRTTIMGPDLGTNWALFFVGCILYLISARISVLTRRQLDNRTFAGVPEISPDESKGVLLQEGIYNVVRHPRYLAVVIGIAGFTMVVNYLGLYLLYLGSMAALLLVVIFEERELEDRFGKEYTEYRSRVPALLPRLGSKARDAFLHPKPPTT
jgi:protein-S-isoprenylcysteine O-methyltransferase Ste14